MKISLNWIKEYVSLPKELEISTLCHDLTMSTVEVEGFDDLTGTLDNVVIGKILEIEESKKPDPKSWVLVTLGGLGLVSIYTDSNELSIGMRLVVALPGAVILDDAGGTNDVSVKVIDNRESEAIICSSKALGLSNALGSSNTKNFIDMSAFDCKEGTSLSDLLDWNDIILEIDNKSLTNRPDLWGHYGIARELAAIYKADLKPIQQYELSEQLNQSEVNEAGAIAGCEMLTAKIDHLETNQTPMIIRSRLAKMDLESTNLYEDLSNYVMLTLGQPSNVYDATKVSLPLIFSYHESTEDIQLESGSKIPTDSHDIFVDDGSGPIALAGIEKIEKYSSLDDASSIILEISNLDPLSVRKSSTRHKVRTESSIRHDKGLDSHLLEPALSLFIFLLEEIQQDIKLSISKSYSKIESKPADIYLEKEFLVKRLGIELEDKIVESLLNSLGFAVITSKKAITVTPPTWRSTGDISIREDLVEEIARMYGYEKFEFSAPHVVIEHPINDTIYKMERRISTYFSGIGRMQEVYTYPWVDSKVLSLSQTDLKHSIKLEAPPSPEFVNLRSSLIPNLLIALTSNLRFYKEVRLFEVGRVFFKPKYTNKEVLQEKTVAGIIYGDNLSDIYREGKGLLHHIGKFAQIPGLEVCSHQSDEVDVPWSDKSGCHDITFNHATIGRIGIVNLRSKRICGIKHGHAVAFEFSIDKLIPPKSRDNTYVPSAELPQVEYDISMIFPSEISWHDIENKCLSVSELIEKVTFVEEYRGKNIDPGSRSLTLNLVLGSNQKTLTTKEVNVVIESLTTMLASDLNAIHR